MAFNKKGEVMSFVMLGNVMSLKSDASRKPRVLLLGTSFVMVCLIAILIGAPTPGPNPAPAVNRDINSYVLFAYYRLQHKGRNSAGTGYIYGGNVGVNYDNPNPNLTELNVEEVYMSNGSQIVGQKISADKPATLLWDVFTNEISPGFEAQIQNSGPTSFALPIVQTNQLPTLPPMFPSTTAALVKVGRNESLTLPPGQYQDIEVLNGGTLTLQPGVYHLRYLDIGSNVTLNTTDQTELRISSHMRFSDGSKMVGSYLTRFYIRSDIMPRFTPSSEASLQFGEGSHGVGQFFVPNGDVNLHRNTRHFGRFWGKTIGNDFSMNISYHAPESISGTKFIDTNGNGVRDAGEMGNLPVGLVFTFYLDINGNGVFDTDLGAQFGNKSEPFANTDAAGSFTIKDVVGGQQVISGPVQLREVGNPNYSCTFPGPCYYTVNLSTTGGDRGGHLFGNAPVVIPQPESVSGSVFTDNNCNSQDDGEPGLGSVSIYLDCNRNGSQDGGELSTATNGSGQFSISNVPAGICDVRAVTPAGHTQTFPAFQFYTVTFGTSGASHGGNVFGFNPTAGGGCNPPPPPLVDSASGSVFLDNDCSGTENPGDSVFPAVTAYLDCNSSGSLDAGELSATTDGNGNWSIPNVPAGACDVRIVAPAGYQCSSPAAGCFYTVVFGATGANHGGNTFGLVSSSNNNCTPPPPPPPNPDSVSGDMFLDTNCNGADDDGASQSGVTFYLDCNNNGTLDAGELSALSANDGSWSIANVPAGTCAVRPVVPAGLQCSFPANSCSYVVTFAGTGTLHSGKLFGFTDPNSEICTPPPPPPPPPPAPESVSGVKFFDANSNGARDGSEAGLAGVTFYVDYNDNAVLDAGEPSAVSAADGSWSIANVNTGSYKVRETGATGYTCTLPTVTCSYPVTIGSAGTNHAGNNFGNALVPPTCEQDPTQPGCNTGGVCEAKDNLHVAIAIDGNSQALNSWAQKAAALTKKLAKKRSKKCKGPSSANLSASLQSAHQDYLTLWFMAYSTFPTVSYDCTGTPPAVCANADFTAAKSEAKTLAQELYDAAAGGLSSCALKTKEGRRIYDAAARTHHKLVEAIDQVPTSALLCQ